MGAAISSADPIWRGGGRGPLAGVRVVDFGQYVAGPLVAMMFADQGADVVRVDPPGGPRWDSPVNATLLRGRRNVTLDLKTDADRARALALASSADVLIENFRPGVAERLGIGRDECLKAAPRLIYCSLPGFGSSDPRADLAAWEGVVMAAAGGYALASPGSSTPATVFSPHTLGSVFAALLAATTVVAALMARDRDGVGQHVEVSLFDALFEASGAGGMSAERIRMTLVDFAPGWFRCADGRYLNLVSLWFRHHEAFIRAAGREAWIDEGLVTYERLQSDPTAAAEIRSRLIELFKERPAREWEALGHAKGSAVAMVRSTAEWMAEPHALASGTLADTDDPILGRTRVPGRAVRLSTAPDSIAAPRQAPGSDNDALLPLLDAIVIQGPPTPASATAAATAPPLAGVRMLDLTRVVAGPTAGKILGQLGAEIIKVDTRNSDQRTMAPLPIAHEYVNRGKRSIDLDLTDPADAQVMTRLLARADLIVQNFTIGVAERLGIDEVSARECNRDVVYAYLNAYGRRGPWANARGYAELANTATGMTERSNGDQPIESGTHSLAFDLPRWPFTDYAAGVLGAFAAVLGLYERTQTGVGPSVETSLIRATALEQITYLLDYEGRAMDEPRGKARGWSPLQSLYEAADGSVFLGARPDQIKALLDALGASGLDGVAGAIVRRTIADLEAVLATVDVGVHRVEWVSDLMKPDGVAAQRGLRIEDETEDFGRVVMVGPIPRLSRTPLVVGAFAKPFGSESDDIRAEVGLPRPS